MESQALLWNKDPTTTGSHYPSITSNAFNDTLYKNRKDNDQLLRQIIEKNRENNEIQLEINSFKQSLPPILLKWWQSNGGVEKINIFLEKLGATVEAQIDSISKHLNEFKSQNQAVQADYEVELKQNQTLKVEVADMEQKLDYLTRKNENKRKDLEDFRKTIPELREQVNSMIREHQILLLEQQAQSHPSMRTKMKEEGSSKDDNIWLIKNILERKKGLHNKLKEIEQQTEKLKSQIEFHEEEKRKKGHIERALITLSEKKHKLNAELENVNIALNKSKKQKEELERQIMEENMEKAIPLYNGLLEQYKSLARRCLQITSKSLDNPNISQVERVLKRQQ